MFVWTNGEFAAVGGTAADAARTVLGKLVPGSEHDSRHRANIEKLSNWSRMARGKNLPVSSDDDGNPIFPARWLTQEEVLAKPPNWTRHPRELLAPREESAPPQKA